MRGYFLDPWEDMGRMRRRMFKLVREPFEFAEGRTAVREPLVDVIDKGDALQVVAELPGVEKKDIRISVAEDSISISTEQREAVKELSEKEGYYYHERSYSKFFRQIPLPATVVPEKATAEHKNGILEVTLPKKVPSKVMPKGRTIEVK